MFFPKAAMIETHPKQFSKIIAHMTILVSDHQWHIIFSEVIVSHSL